MKAQLFTGLMALQARGSGGNNAQETWEVKLIEGNRKYYWLKVLYPRDCAWTFTGVTLNQQKMGVKLLEQMLNLPRGCESDGQREGSTELSLSTGRGAW